MANVYISKKVERIIKPHQQLLPNYYVLNENEKIRNAYVVLCDNEINHYSLSKTNSIFVVKHSNKELSEMYNVVEHDAMAITYLIQSLCCSPYDVIYGKSIKINYHPRMDSPNVEPINRLNKFINESLLLNLDRFLFCSAFMTVGVLFFMSKIHHLSLFSNAVWDQSMPFVSLGLVIMITGLVLGYWMDKWRLKKKCQLIKNKGNLAGLYYISNAIEGIDVV